jgi:hypothetical protein
VNPGRLRKVTIDAFTDQAVAELAHLRDSPDELVQAQRRQARSLTEVIAEQAGPAAPGVGRALVTSAAWLSGLLDEMREGGADDRPLPVVLTNILGLAGEALTRRTGEAP